MACMDLIEKFLLKSNSLFRSQLHRCWEDEEFLTPASQRLPYHRGWRRQVGGRKHFRVPGPLQSSKNWGKEAPCLPSPGRQCAQTHQGTAGLVLGLRLRGLPGKARSPAAAQAGHGVQGEAVRPTVRIMPAGFSVRGSCLWIDDHWSVGNGDAGERICKRTPLCQPLWTPVRPHFLNLKSI